MRGKYKFAATASHSIEPGQKVQEKTDAAAERATPDADDEFTSGNINLLGGFFLSDSLELGIGPSFRISSGGSGGVDTTVSLTTFGRWYFTTQNPQFTPYVGGEFFFQDLKPENGDIIDQSFTNAIAGVKYYFSESVAFDLKAGYGFNVKNSDQGIITTTFGIAVVL